MSALGQKQTYAPQTVMSALHPIATTKLLLSKTRGCFDLKSGRLDASSLICFVPTSYARRR